MIDEKSWLSDAMYERMKKQSIRVAIGYRLYELFCLECNAVLMTENEHLQELQCDKCGRMYGYRMHPEMESACLQMMMEKPQIQ